MRLRGHAIAGRLAVILGALALVLPAPLYAQGIQTVDPNTALDADLAPLPSPDGAQDQSQTDPSVAADPQVYDNQSTTASDQAAPSGPVIPANGAATYQEDDLIGAAEGVFGKGAKGLAGIIEKILKEQGQPNAYITGREASGAFVVGLRYGSGTLFHKVEGQRQVYWTGPSVGFDFGANAGNTFVLVYNLYDSEDIYRRYPAGEGGAYLVGGFTASYLRRGNVVLIPVRLGVGYRIGVNAGYMKFTETSKWMPF